MGGKLMEQILACDAPFKEEQILGGSSLVLKTTNSPFLKEVKYSRNAKIDVNRIVGTVHQDYEGLTWLEFLSTGKRIKSNLEHAEKNPLYYYDAEQKDHLSFVSIDDGDLFIEEGNHRSAIAKFLFYVDGKNTNYLKGVNVTRFKTHKEMSQKAEELLSLFASSPVYENIFVEFVQQKGAAGHEIDQSIQKYYPILIIKNASTEVGTVISGENEKHFMKEIELLMTAIRERKWWSRYFSKNKYATLIG